MSAEEMEMRFLEEEVLTKFTRVMRVAIKEYDEAKKSDLVNYKPFLSDADRAAAERIILKVETILLVKNEVEESRDPEKLQIVNDAIARIGVEIENNFMIVKG